jgi:hypothetical protein
MIVQLLCRVCNGPAPMAERCTNGCCARCHREYCTSGGSTGPGHGLKVYAVETPLGEHVFVQAGTVGNFEYRDENLWQARFTMQSKRETSAALAGSMFGWDCGGARVESYNEDGSPVRKGKGRRS